MGREWGRVDREWGGMGRTNGSAVVITTRPLLSGYYERVFSASCCAPSKGSLL